MGKIVLLDENTINKIAAGEVIEKPASIVKELVENAIDAGSTAVSIEVADGGKSFINVTDNGFGILESDAEQVFYRHATSKIRSAKDLFSIHTLGFRGEAMASIAAVADVELKTRAEEDQAGSFISIKGGKLLERKSIGYPIGTSVTVRDLFYNTPARLKFLKSDLSEQSYIVDIVEKLALTNTGISFKLTVNNKIVLHTPGNGDLLSVILCIYGKNTAKAMLPLKHENNVVSIEGYIGKPEIAKGNSTFMIFSVNGRSIKNKMLAEAVRQAYKTLLMNNKYPFAILDIRIQSDLIDVNVHPTKQEVKFSDDRAIFNTLYIAIKNCLSTNQLMYSFEESDSPAVESTASSQAERGSAIPLPITRPAAAFVERPFETKRDQFEQMVLKPEIPEPGIVADKAVMYDGRKETAVSYIEHPIAAKPDIVEEGSPTESVQEAGIPLRIIGQLFGTYILCQHQDQFYIIDQHAAHERIMYEYLKERYQTNSITIQSLLLPIIIEMSPVEKLLYEQHNALFQRLGFEIEWFGENAVAVRAIPIIMGEPCSGEFFTDMLASLKDGAGSTAETASDKVIISMACKNAVKAGDNLSQEEVCELLNRLFMTKALYTCPHGRPTIITMSRLEIEKKFKRVL